MGKAVSIVGSVLGNSSGLGLFGSLLSTGLSLATAKKEKAPTVPVAPIKDELATDEKKTKAARAALYETGGGAAGSELQAGQVSQRQTLFGN